MQCFRNLPHVVFGTEIYTNRSIMAPPTIFVPDVTDEQRRNLNGLLKDAQLVQTPMDLNTFAQLPIVQDAFQQTLQAGVAETEFNSAFVET